MGFSLLLLCLPLLLELVVSPTHEALDKAFEKLDQDFERFIERRLGYELLKKAAPLEINKEELLEEAFVQLRPQADQILREFEAHRQSFIRFIYQSKYFCNLEQLGRLFLRHQRYKSIASAQKQAYWHSALEHALLAQLAKKELELRLGNTLNP